MLASIRLLTLTVNLMFFDANFVCFWQIIRTGSVGDPCVCSNVSMLRPFTKLQMHFATCRSKVLQNLKNRQLLSRNLCCSWIISCYIFFS